MVVRAEHEGVGLSRSWFATAEKLGITGYARNLHTGEVEVHAEGEDAALDRFKLELERGPRMSRVTEVIENDVPSGSHSSFLIRG